MGDNRPPDGWDRCGCCGGERGVLAGMLAATGCLQCDLDRTYCHCGAILMCGCGRELGHTCPASATNALGHRCAAPWAVPNGKYGGRTLGAYRRGKFMTWIPGAVIATWTPCGRGDQATGVPWPHAYFIQTIGGDDGGSIYCPACRADLVQARARPAPTGPPPAPASATLQAAVPWEESPF